jgi:hypothetical protein
MGQENSLAIYVEVISKSKSGRSLARPGVTITSENVDEFAPYSRERKLDNNGGV